jgi:hypothetical protein
MAETSRYKLHGTKNQGEKVGRVKVDGKTLVVGGESVELTEKQAEELKARGLDVRKTGGGSHKPDEEASSEDNPSSGEEV